MEPVQCQCMTIMIILLIINIGLVVGVFVKWSVAQKKCPGGEFRRASERQILGAPEILENTIEYPFIVSITYSEEGDIGNQLHCGGVIVGNKWTLTAGHCIEILQELPYKNIAVYGGSKLWRISVKHQVYFMVHHNAYNSQTYHADIGLVKVKEEFQGSFERPIAIAGSSYKYEINSTVTAVGWSGSYLQNEYRGHEMFHSTSVLIFDYVYCENVYKEIGENVTNSMFCAGSYKGEKPACHLDSGGPLVDGDLLIGVVSWGRDCGKVDQPIIYTNVSIYKKWLHNIMEDEEG